MPPRSRNSRSSKGSKRSHAYMPLPPDCTRVLILLPGRSDEPLKAELEIVSLTDLRSAAKHTDCVARGRESPSPSMGLGVPLIHHPDRSHRRFFNETENVEGECRFREVREWEIAGKLHWETPTELDCRKARAILPLGYECISYAWGELVFPHSIEIAGESFPLTSSLYGALRRFRQVDRSKRLWADALCIDQQNHEERAQQVAIIADIFAAASAVLIWLGPACERDTLAFATMHKLAELGGIGWTDRLRDFICDRPFCACCGDSFKPSTNVINDCMEACALLLRRSWFTRLWVVQEISGRGYGEVMIYVGAHSVAWGDFDFTMQRCWHYFSGRSQPSHGMNNSSSLQHQHVFTLIARIIRTSAPQPHYFPSTGFLQDLVSLSERQCYDPLDRVFAIRPILGLQDIDVLRPDYQLRPAQLYARVIRVATQCMRGQQLHDNREESWYECSLSLMFSLAGTETTGDRISRRNWPSWVPDFDQLTSRSRSKLFSCIPSAALSHQILGRVKINFEDDETVSIHGRIYGVIDHVLPQSQCPRQHEMEESRIDSSFVPTVLEDLLGWITNCITFVSERCKTHALSRAHDLSAILASDVGETQEGLPASDSRENPGSPVPLISEEMFLKGVSRICKGRSDLGIIQEADPSELYKLLNLFMALELSPAYDHGRLLCAMRLDDDETALTVGWVSQLALAGDIICCMGGMPNPIVLRPTENKSHYQVIGDSWFYDWGLPTLAPRFGFKLPEVRRASRGKISRERLMQKWYSSKEQTIRVR